MTHSPMTSRPSTFPEGFQTFAINLMNRHGYGPIGKGESLPDAFVPRLLEIWEALPEFKKIYCKEIEAAREQQNKPVEISTQRTFPQISPHDSPPSVSTSKLPAMLVASGAAAAPVATQHFSSSSCSTTPSPPTPLLSPSPFCSPQIIPNDLPYYLSTAAPSPSQPEPLNIGNNWPGVQYGASRKVEFLMENQPSHSSGGRHAATKQPARSHPYALTGTSVPVPGPHGGQPQTTRMGPLRRTQTVFITPTTKATPSVANVPPSGSNVVSRSHTAPSLGASSHTSRAPQAARPFARVGPVTHSGRQPPHPAVLDRRSSVESVEGLPAAPNRARQPTPTPSSPYASVAPYASPVAQMQTPTPIPGSPQVYTPSAGHQVQTMPVHAAVPLSPSFGQHLPAQAASTTTITTVPVGATPQEFDAGSSRPLTPDSFMDFLRWIPTPSVTDVVDVDAFLDAILAPQIPVPVVPGDNFPLPDAFRTWPPGHWSEYWLDSGYPTGWEDFAGFPAQ